MQKLVYLMVSLSTSFLLMGGANAAKENWNWLKDLPEYQPSAEVVVSEYPLSNKEVFEKQLKISKANSGRKIAQTAGDVLPVSAKLTGLIREINAIQTPERLHELLLKFQGDAEYNKYEDSPESQFLIAQLAPLIVYRGLFFRLRPLLRAEQSGVKKLFKSSGVTHSLMVTFARQLAASTAIYFPQSQWKAAYKYVSEPLLKYSEIWAFVGYEDKGTKAKVTGMELFQKWLENDVYNVLAKAEKRMDDLANKNVSFVWDNRVVFASEKFVDGPDRYRQLGRTECLALRSAYLAAKAGIKMFAAYNMNDLINVNYRLGTTIGFDSMEADVSGLSAEQRRNILVNEFGQFLKRRGTEESHRAKMLEAYKDIKESVAAAELVWNETKERPDDGWKILDPGAFRPFQRIVSNSVGTVKRVVDSQGPETINSAVTGTPITVKFHHFFDRPPADLKAFLPNGFDPGNTRSEYETKTFTEVVEKTPKTFVVHLRDYNKGRAIAWNWGAYQEYFPGLQDSEGVKLAAQILMQSWGGWGIGIPMAFAVQ